MSLQLSCSGTCQIWMWSKQSNRCIGEIEHFSGREIYEQSFSNPTSGLLTGPHLCGSMVCHKGVFALQYPAIYWRGSAHTAVISHGAVALWEEGPNNNNNKKCVANLQWPFFMNEVKSGLAKLPNWFQFTHICWPVFVVMGLQCNALHITVPLWGEFTGHQWIPLKNGQ